MSDQKKNTEEYIMVVPALELWRSGYFEGLCFNFESYLSVIEGQQIDYKLREDMETNPNYKQIIPYVILYHNGTFFSYRRGKLLGEQRLLGSYSIGVGGHISTTDRNLFDTSYNKAMRRELTEEIEIGSTYKEYIAALLNDDSNEVGRVHFGMVHILCLDTPIVKPREKSMNEPAFVDQSHLLKNIDKYENWSQICIRNIEHILAACNKKS
jgi:predicted NUDIX family phosphoesterase